MMKKRQKDRRKKEPRIGVKAEVDGPVATGIDVNTGNMPEDETEPTPEEQDQYNRIATKLKQFIGSEKGAKLLLDQMNNQSSPIYDNVGRAAAMIGRMIKGSIESSGEEPLGDAIMNAGADYAIPLLFELGEAGGVFDLSPEDEQEQMELAMLAAVEHYGNAEAQQGTLPTTEAQEFMRQKFAEDGGDYNKFIEQGVSGSEPGAMSPMARGVKTANAGGNLL